MPSFTFRSDKPYEEDAVGYHGPRGRVLDELMSNPAYWDQNHPQHQRVRGDVESLTQELYGTQAANFTNPDGHLTIKTGPANQEPGQ